MAIQTVAMADGGGGNVSALLSMREVIDLNTAEQTPRVLYADTIDADAVSKIIDNLAVVTSEGGLGPSTSTLIRDNDEMMAASNSQRFYTGEVAQAQFTAMEDVNAKLSTLLGNVDAIYNNKAAILSSIETYNTRLKELKKECRITLLRNAADRWNLEKHVEKTKRVYSSPFYPMKETVIGASEYVYSEPTNIQTNQVQTSSDSFAISYTYDYDRIYYKIIKYWNGLKNISWFKDPGFAEVEAMFEEVGAPLPYNKNLILPKE